MHRVPWLLEAAHNERCVQRAQEATIKQDPPPATQWEEPYQEVAGPAELLPESKDAGDEHAKRKRLGEDGRRKHRRRWKLRQRLSTRQLLHAGGQLREGRVKTSQSKEQREPVDTHDEKRDADPNDKIRTPGTATQAGSREALARNEAANQERRNGGREHDGRQQKRHPTRRGSESHTATEGDALHSPGDPPSGSEARAHR